MCIRFINPEVDSTRLLDCTMIRVKKSLKAESNCFLHVQSSTSQATRRRRNRVYCSVYRSLGLVRLITAEQFPTQSCWLHAVVDVDPTEVCKGILLNARVSFQFIKHTIVMCSIERNWSTSCIGHWILFYWKGKGITSFYQRHTRPHFLSSPSLIN